MIRTALVALPKSPMNLAQGDEVPQIITRRTRQRPSEFLTPPAKRLLQHNPPNNRHLRLERTLPFRAITGNGASAPGVGRRRVSRALWNLIQVNGAEVTLHKV
jgi:hypothetical protein